MLHGEILFVEAWNTKLAGYNFTSKITDIYIFLTAGTLHYVCFFPLLKIIGLDI